MNLSHVITKEEEPILKKKFDEAVVASLKGGDIDGPAATLVSKKMKDLAWEGKSAREIMNLIRTTIYNSLKKTNYTSYEPMKPFYRKMELL